VTQTLELQMIKWFINNVLEKMWQQNTVPWVTIPNFSRGLRKTTRSLRQDSRSLGRYLNSWPPEYAEILPTSRDVKLCIETFSLLSVSWICNIPWRWKQQVYSTRLHGVVPQNNNSKGRKTYSHCDSECRKRDCFGNRYPYDIFIFVPTGRTKRALYCPLRKVWYKLTN
jgi:hypothetical protein